MKTIQEINAFTNDYINQCSGVHGPWKLPEADQKEMSLIVLTALEAILEESGTAKKWEQATYYLPPSPSNMAEVKMKKTGATFRLMLYAGEVVFQFSLPKPSEIPSMDNAFWSLLSSAVINHGVTFIPYADSNAIAGNQANAKLAKFRKAAVFAFINEFIVAYQHDQSFQAMGDFELPIWFRDSDWHSIIDRLVPVLADFSKLSQSLYRSYYIKASKSPTAIPPESDIEVIRCIYTWIYDRTETWSKNDVKAAFPKATAGEIRSAHSLACNRKLATIVSTTGTKPLIYGRCPEFAD